MSKRLLSLITTVVLLSSVFGVAQARVEVTTQPNPIPSTSPYITPVPANGFIMSDGRICNPRWGC